MVRVRRVFMSGLMVAIVVSMVDMSLYLSSGSSIGMIVYYGSQQEDSSSPCRHVHCPTYLPERLRIYRPMAYGDQGDKVVIVTPVFNNTEKVLPYLDNLCCLGYPRHLISVVILEGATANESLYSPRGLARELSSTFRRVGVVAVEDMVSYMEQKQSQESKDAGNTFSMGTQFLKALEITEDWVLWMGADVMEVPSDLIQRLIAAEKDIIVPSCMVRKKANTTQQSSQYQGKAEVGTKTHWEKLKKTEEENRLLQLEIISQQQLNMTNSTFVYEKPTMASIEEPLDSIHSTGDCVALVRTECYGKNLILPSMLEGYLNLNGTYGLSVMAEVLGTSLYGMPTLQVYHN